MPNLTPRVKFGMEEGTEGPLLHATTEGPLLHAKLNPHRCNVSPLRGEKPQNRPLGKLNTGRFALRAMLPVTKSANRTQRQKYCSNMSPKKKKMK